MTFRFAHPQTAKSSQARWSMRCVFTTVLGSRPGDSFRCVASLVSSAARWPSFLDLVGLNRRHGISGSSYQRAICAVLAIAPHRVVPVGSTRYFPATWCEPMLVNSLRARPLLRLGPDASLREEFRVERVAYGDVTSRVSRCPM